MPIVPSGDPAWVRTSDHTTYGGDTNKTNWHSQGATNARTDVGAEAFCRMTADLEAVMRTAPWCVLTVTCDDATPGPPTIAAVNQMTGQVLTPYVGNAPPAGMPSAARDGNGAVTFTWESSYDDPYGVSGDINIQHAEVSAKGSTALIPVYNVADVDANGFNEVVSVKIFTDTGAAAVSPSFTLSVCTGTPV